MISSLWRKSVDDFYFEEIDSLKYGYGKQIRYPSTSITVPLDATGCSKLRQFERFSTCQLVGKRLTIWIGNFPGYGRKMKRALRAIDGVPDSIWQQVEHLEIKQSNILMLENQDEGDIEEDEVIDAWGGLYGLLQPFLRKMENVTTLLIDIFNNPCSLMGPLLNLPNLEKLEQIHAKHGNMLRPISDWNSVLHKCKHSLKMLYAHCGSTNLMTCFEDIDVFPCLQILYLKQLDFSNNCAMPALKSFGVTVFTREECLQIASHPTLTKLKSLAHLEVSLNNRDLSSPSFKKLKNFEPGSSFVTTLDVTHGRLASVVNFAQLFPCLRYLRFEDYKDTVCMIGKYAEKPFRIGEEKKPIWDYLPKLVKLQILVHISRVGSVSFFRSDYNMINV